VHATSHRHRSAAKRRRDAITHRHRSAAKRRRDAITHRHRSAAKRRRDAITSGAPRRQYSARVDGMSGS